MAFLAGDGASYMTATTIFADGGIMQGSPGTVGWMERSALWISGFGFQVRQPAMRQLPSVDAQLSY